MSDDDEAERSKLGQAWKFFKTAMMVLAALCFVYLVSFFVVMFLVDSGTWTLSNQANAVINYFYAPVFYIANHSPTVGKALYGLATYIRYKFHHN